jgi:hypothetical protein
MLTDILDVEIVRCIYQCIYHTAINTIRATGKNDYAPSLDKYTSEDDLLEFDYSVIRTKGDITAIEKDGRARVWKPPYAYDIIRFKPAHLNPLIVVGKINIYLFNGTGLDNAFYDLLKLVRYGIGRLEKELLGAAREFFTGGFLYDGYSVAINSVRISAQLEYSKVGPETLKVIYGVTIVDEKTLRPVEDEEDRRVGEEFRKIAEKTTLGTDFVWPKADSVWPKADSKN